MESLGTTCKRHPAQFARRGWPMVPIQAHSLLPLEVNKCDKTGKPPLAHLNTLAPSRAILSMRKCAEWPDTQAPQVQGRCTHQGRYGGGGPPIARGFPNRFCSININPSLWAICIYILTLSNILIIKYKAAARISCKKTEGVSGNNKMVP